MNSHIVSGMVFVCCANLSAASTNIFSSKTVDDYRADALNSEMKEIINAPELCDVLSEDACSLITRDTKFKIQQPVIGHQDRLILKELLSLSSEDEAKEDQINEARKSILRNSALTLGFQVGYAMEGARYNRIWNKYESVFENINFSPFMIDHRGGSNIVPPVVTVMDDSIEVGAGGRVFRLAETVYRIKKQPMFSVTLPTWRDYLHIKVERPEKPISSLLPSTGVEAEFWRSYLVRGYSNGINAVRETVKAQYRELAIDYVGMATYHLLRTYNMISEPIVESTYSPVTLTHSGESMSLDDTISVLSVKPKLNISRQQWKVFPQLKRLSEIQRNIIARGQAYAY